MQVIKINDNKKYHDFVRYHEKSTILQTPEWGNMKVNTGNWRTECLFVVDDQQQTVAALTVLYRQLPYIKQYLAYAPRGIITDFNNEQQFKAIILALKAYFKTQKVFDFKIDPDIMWRQRDIDYNIIPEGIDNSNFRTLLLDCGFEQKPFDLGFDGIQHRMTMVVNLFDEGQGVIQQMSKRLRYDIKNAHNKGVVCFKGNYKDLVIYDELNQITAQRDHFIPRSLKYLQTLYSTLNSAGMLDLYFAKVDFKVALEFVKQQQQNNDQQLIKITQQLSTATNEQRQEKLTRQLAELNKISDKYIKEIKELEDKIIEFPEGQILSGAIVAYYGDKAFYLYGANITEYTNLNANKALQLWIMQKLYDEEGIRKYDLFGVASENNPEDQQYGLSQFKRNFSPELVEYIGEFDLPINKFWYKLFQEYAPKIIAFKNQRILKKYGK